ncbi:hypothetical protein KBD68_00430 [Candidatus Woesebacteria bacterium]|nr:hypothetical protein [Candidatus Woesebacteria bacterium]
MKDKTEMKSKVNPVVITAVVAIVVAAAAFFSGMKYQQMKTGSIGFTRGANMVGARNGQGMMGGNRQGFGGVSGEVTANDGTSMTVKMSDGSSKIVILSDSTTVSKTSDGAKADLSVGAKVAVFGPSNSDGSVTAQNVQLNPSARMFAGQGMGR